MSAPVLVAVDDGLVRITLARPATGNAIRPETIAALADAVAVAERPEIHAVLLAAEGRNFCVGADLRHFQESDAPLPQQLDAMAVDFHAMLLRLTRLPVPIVAAVQGNVVGGGLGLMLAADVVVGSESAKIATGYTKLGLSADAGVSHFLTQAAGPRLARSLLISARTLDALECRTLGLIDTLASDDALAGEAERIACTLRSGPTSAFATIKRLVATAASGSTFSDHLDRERAEIVALADTAFAKAAVSRMLAR